MIHPPSTQRRQDRLSGTLQPAALEDLRHGFYGLLTETVGALDDDQLSEESFRSFRGVRPIARDVIGERFRSLRTEGSVKRELRTDAVKDQAGNSWRGGERESTNARKACSPRHDSAQRL